MRREIKRIEGQYSQMPKEVSVIILQNDLASINYTIENARIHGVDIKDVYNETTCFNTTKRSIKKAWRLLEEKFTDTTTLWDACNILRDGGIKMHTYCAVD